jgi:hypothetical protein
VRTLRRRAHWLVVGHVCIDVIDTATDAVTTTIRVGQDPMALVYVAGAVPHGDGRREVRRRRPVIT